PDRRCGYAGARVGELRGLEERLNGSVLPERSVKRDEHDGRRVGGREPIERRTGGHRTLAIQRRRVVVGGRLQVFAAMAWRQPPPAAVEVDQYEVDDVTGRSQRIGDGGARDDGDVMLRRRTTK